MKRLLAAIALVAGCAPDLPRGPSQVERPALLAVRSDPAEATPGSAVTLTALLATPTTTAAPVEFTWAFCASPRPVAAPTAIPAPCVSGDPPASRPVTSKTVVPADACALFGSTPPPAPAGEPPRRPADPDVHGGYSIPVRVAGPAGDPIAFGAVRLSCPLLGAPASVARAYRERAVANQNPALLTFGPAGETIDAGAPTRVIATWAQTAFESFVFYDPATATLVDARERLRVSWYADTGVLSRDTDDVPDGASGIDVVWTAPVTPGSARLWVVLRDDRGGVDWASVDVAVQAR